MATLDLFSSYSDNLSPFFPKSVPLAPSIFFGQVAKVHPQQKQKKKKNLLMTNNLFA